jgi:hypothetical protein
VQQRWWQKKGGAGLAHVAFLPDDDSQGLPRCVRANLHRSCSHAQCYMKKIK